MVVVRGVARVEASEAVSLGPWSVYRVSYDGTTWWCSGVKFPPTLRAKPLTSWTPRYQDRRRFSVHAWALRVAHASIGAHVHNDGDCPGPRECGLRNVNDPDTDASGPFTSSATEHTGHAHRSTTRAVRKSRGGVVSVITTNPEGRKQR